MKVHTFDARIWLPQPVAYVFPFFGDAHNLECHTPPFLKFNVITPAPIEMAPGTRIPYRLRLRGIQVSWESEITAWEPPHRFIDEQRHGPYRLWKHEHRFAEREGGTDVSDHVDYAVLGRPDRQCPFRRAGCAPHFRVSRPRLDGVVCSHRFGR
jgi:ligand-binding SRPBCC domain-containing protein